MAPSFSIYTIIRTRPATVYATDLTVKYTDADCDWVFDDEDSSYMHGWHSGTSGRNFYYDMDTFGYIYDGVNFTMDDITSLSAAKSNGVAAWATSGVYHSSGCSPVKISYNMNLAGGSSVPQCGFIAITKTLYEVSDGHFYKWQIELSHLFFRNGSVSSNIYFKSHALAHEIGHSYGMGHSIGIMSEVADYSISSNPSCTDNQKIGMMLLNHIHTCSNYSRDQHYMSGNELTQYHKKRCTECKSYEVESHQMPSYFNKYNGSGHWKECMCGYALSSIYQHSMTVNQYINANQHKKKCSACAYYYMQNHVYTYQNQGVSGHLKYCMYCSSPSSYSIHQPHDLIYSGGIWCCRFCSYNESGYKSKKANETHE